MTAEIEFLGEEFERDYEGDTPWYTIRFVASYSAAKQAKIDNLFMKLPILFNSWSSKQICSLECELTRDELQDWPKHRLEVRKQIELVHELYPIEAVAFYDEGELSER